MSLLYPWVLALLAIPLLLWRLSERGEEGWRRRFTPAMYALMRQRGGMSRRTRRMLYLLASALMIVALSRPVLERGDVTVRSRVADLVVAFDISRSMQADDIYPSRLDFAKRKFEELLSHLEATRVGVIGFASRAFLVAPPTEDYGSLGYLVRHMSTDYLSLRGTDMRAPLEVTADLLAKRGEKALLLFTDGGDKKDFSDEIAYAKAHGIKVFVYAVATRKGAAIRAESGDLIRDASGRAVISRLNPAVAKLAEETGGLYMPYAIGRDDMKEMAAAIRGALEEKETRIRRIRNRQELYHYPLAAALLCWLAASISLPRRRTKEAV